MYTVKRKEEILCAVRLHDESKYIQPFCNKCRRVFPCRNPIVRNNYILKLSDSFVTGTREVSV